MGKVSLICAALVLAGCSPLERSDVADGINAYNSGTLQEWVDRNPSTEFPGTPLGPAIIDTALKATGKATSIPELIAYIAGLIAAVGGGYVARKWIQKKYTPTTNAK